MFWWWKFDRRIKDIARESEIQVPEEFEDRMNKLYESLLEREELDKAGLSESEEKPGRVSVPFRYGIIVAGILCLLLVMVPVSANLQGYWERMAAMDDTEKEQYVSGLEETYTFEGDNYSRKFTVSELERRQELTLSYENGERYPTGEIAYIEQENAIQSEKVCFLTKTSTFYLPDSELTDEQLLELIDFVHKREYSLENEVAEIEGQDQDTDTEEGNASASLDDSNDGSTGERLDRKDAISMGEEWIQKVYNRDVAGWDTSVKKMDSAKKGYNIYRITYTEKKTLAEYMISVCDTDGRVIKMRCVYNGNVENVFKGLSINSKKDIRKCYREVKELAKILDDSKEIVSGTCEYFLDRATDQLSFGTIAFWLEYSDGTGLNIYFSLNSQEYFQINYIEEELQKIREGTSSNFESSMVKKTIQFE